MKVKRRSPRLTRLEKLTKGLSRDPEKYKSKFSVCEVEGKGRSLFLLKGVIKKDSFVLEYEGDYISHREAEKREAIYASNKEGCYILFFKFQRRKVAVDATRHFSSYARYLNHSRQPNIKFHAPIIVDLDGNGVPRIAAYALKDIHEGDEISFDYGVSDGDISWLKNKKTCHMSELPSDQSDSDSSSEDETSSDLSEVSVQKSGMSSLPPAPLTNPSASSSASRRPIMPSTSRLSSALVRLQTDDYAMRFISRPSRLAVRPSYVVEFEKLDKPETILRIVNDRSLSKRPPSVISLSDSESLGKPESILPLNAEPNCISKVMDWQCNFNDAESGFKILKVESFGVAASELRPNSSGSTSLSTVSDRTSCCLRISNTMCGDMVPKQFVPPMEDSSFNKAKTELYNKRGSNVSDIIPPVKPLYSHPSTSHQGLPNDQMKQLSQSKSVVPLRPFGEDKRQQTIQTPVLRKMLGHSDRIPSKCNYFETHESKRENVRKYDESLSRFNKPGGSKSLSDDAPANEDDDDDLIVVDSPATPKASSAGSSEILDFDLVEVISSSDESQSAQASMVNTSSELKRSVPAQKSFQAQKTDVREHCQGDMLGQSTSSGVENFSKRGVHGFPGDKFSSASMPPSPSQIVIEEDMSVDEKPHDQTSKMLASLPIPDIIIEDDSDLPVMNYCGPRMPLSTSAALPSHHGSSVLRQCLASPPVAVIKPFNASDGLDINEDEMLRLREILGPHLFSDNALKHNIEAAILKNWNFFKTLTERGVSLDDIRASVRKFMKQAERERRKNAHEKAPTSSDNFLENDNIS